MTDCPNVEMRERLPEYLHGTLPESVRVEVDAHLEACRDCAAELEVLRQARRVLDAVRVPRFDAATIVAALPRPAGAVTAGDRPAPLRVAASGGARRARRSPTLFRLAAAISFISLGGISVAVARSYLGTSAPLSVDSVVTTRPGGLTAVAPSTGGTESPASPTGAARTLSMHPSVGALDDADLELLLGELDALEAVPLAEPESIPGGRAVAGSFLGS